MGDFRFIKETHEYFLGTRRMESVTEILVKSGISDFSFSSEEAALRGKYVHAATEMIDRGTLDWDALDVTLRPYCEAYRLFLSENRPSFIVSEKPMYHPVHLFAGTPDRVAMMNGMVCLIDYKSGTPGRGTKYQVAAYRELVQVREGITCTKCFAIHLQGNGRYRVYPMDDHRHNYNIFLAALTVERCKQEER